MRSETRVPRCQVTKGSSFASLSGLYVPMSRVDRYNTGRERKANMGSGKPQSQLIISTTGCIMGMQTDRHGAWGAGSVGRENMCFQELVLVAGSTRWRCPLKASKKKKKPPCSVRRMLQCLNLQLGRARKGINVPLKSSPGVPIEPWHLSPWIGQDFQGGSG